ncbi:MAG: alkaline phosphatase family protein [bacterium JZ-2024 1]
MRKIAVIGLDGAEYTLVERFIKEKKLPTLRKIQEKGFFCMLPSTIPPLTCVAWTAFLTGKNPAKTGIYDFYQVKREIARVYYPNASYIRAETLPEIFSREGRVVGLVNVPFTYPASAVKGFNLPGLGAPDQARLDYAYPPGLLKKIRDKTGRDYHPLPEPREFGPQYHILWKDILQQLDHKRQFVPFLWEEFQPDFFCIVFSETDAVEHYYWKFMDSTHPLYDPEGAQKYGSAIEEVFQKVDSLIEEWLSLFGSDTNVFLLSDHGMGPFYLAPDYLGYLSYRGLMHLKEGVSDVRRVLPKFFLLYFIWRVSRNLVEWGKKNLPWTVRNFLNRVFPGAKHFVSWNFSFLDLIDWGRSRVYFADPRNIGYLFINLKGREPFGIVEPEEYERVCDFLIADLESLKVPGTDVPIVSKVYRRKEIYAGPFLEEMPDLIILWNLDALTYFNWKERNRTDVSEVLLRLFQPLPVIPMGGKRTIPYNAFHTRRGIFLACGPDIQPDALVDNPKIVDIFPTLLALADIPIPSDVDGRILWEIFRDETKKRLAPRYREPEGKGMPSGYTPEQEERLKQHLRLLGYLE